LKEDARLGDNVPNSIRPGNPLREKKEKLEERSIYLMSPKWREERRRGWYYKGRGGTSLNRKRVSLETKRDPMGKRAEGSKRQPRDGGGLGAIIRNPTSKK